MTQLEDPHARDHNYINRHADWITFEATVSTSPDQVALAPGDLQREWSENGRRYFHYRTSGRVVPFFAFLSALFAVYAVLPSIRPPKKGFVGKPNKLFFGHFTQLDEDEWTVRGAVAADGIDEVLQVFFPRLTARGRRPDVRSRIRLVATDVDQSWVIGPGDGDGGTPVQLHPSRDVDAVVSGSARELYLALWHRMPASRLEFDGDDGVALMDGPTTP